MHGYSRARVSLLHVFCVIQGPINKIQKATMSTSTFNTKILISKIISCKFVAAFLIHFSWIIWFMYVFIYMYIIIFLLKFEIVKSLQFSQHLILLYFTILCIFVCFNVCLCMRANWLRCKALLHVSGRVITWLLFTVTWCHSKLFLLFFR